MPTVDGVYYPDYSAVEADVPADMLLMAESLRGRTVRNHASTSARDTAVQALPASARQGALVYVQGRGWQGYTKADDPYDATSASWWDFDRVKGKRKDSTGAEGNGMHRVDSADCFFDGQQPSSFTATPIVGEQWYVDVAFGVMDGAGALIKAIDRRDNSPLLGAVAFYWIAYR